MSDIRKNFLTGEVVLMATQREKRPIHFAESKNKRFNVSKKNCCFCDGNENMTTKALYISPNKKCRIVSNKYPAIQEDAGYHEVIIDTNEHTKKIFQQNTEDFLETLVGLRLRELHHYRNPDVKYVQIFKNDGVQAGASIEHSHFQLLAINYIPNKINVITENFTRFKNENNSCYICTLKEEIDYFTFYENSEFKAVVMYDGVYAYGIDIFPKKHINCFSDINENVLFKLSDCIIKSLYSLNKLKNNFDYNILFQSNKNENFHFHLKIIPRTGKFGGFELATGDYINSVLPEIAAKNLKENIKLDMEV